MKQARGLSGLVLLCALLACLGGCSRPSAPSQDHPRLTSDIELRDITFHSAALNRDMPYRVILPKQTTPERKLPVIYLLHGGGGGFRDWSNYSDIDSYAARGFLLVMPEGGTRRTT